MVSITLPDPTPGQTDWGDTINTALTALESAINSMFVNALDYCTVDGLADNTTDLQSAATAAVGKTLVLPDAGAAYILSDGISISSDTRVIVAYGAKIEQTVWFKPVWDCLDADRVHILGGYYEYTGATARSVGASVRGGSNYLMSTAVWANGNDVSVRCIRTKNLATGVTFAAWDGVSANETGHSRNRFSDGVFEGADFGIFGYGQTDLILNNVYDFSNVDSSSGANPVHALYIDGLTAACDGVKLTNWFTRDCDGHAITVKGTTNLKMNNIDAIDCGGTFVLIDVENVSGDAITSIDEKASIPGSAGVFAMQYTTGNTDASFSNLYAKMTNEQRCLAMWSEYLRLSNVVIESVRDGAAPAEYDVVLRGDHGRVNGITVTNRGSSRSNAIALGATVAVDDWVISGVRVTKVANMVDIYAASTDVTIEYERGQQRDVTGNYVTQGAGADYRVLTDDQHYLSTFGRMPGDHAFMAANTITAAAGDDALQVVVVPERDITPTKFVWFCSVQNGNYDVAILDDAGARLWSKGSTACPTAGEIIETVTGGIILRAGRKYQLTIAMDGTAMAVRGIAVPVTNMNLGIGSTALVGRTASSFPIPSTLTMSAAGTRIPLIQLREA